MDDEPLDPLRVKNLLIEIMATGTLAFSNHAYETDVLNTLRSGVYQPGELERGSWRYRAGTSRMAAVVTFRSETHKH